jgi:hypothetical protein
MMALRLFLTTLIMCAVTGLSASFGAEKLILITDEEAARPAQLAGDLGRRGITRGPQVTLLSPAQDAASLASPIHLQLKFESHGGANIDTGATRITYMKDPAVDLTDRIKPFLQSDGLDIAEAVLPPGNHVIRVDIKDTDGRTFGSLFTLNIRK